MTYPRYRLYEIRTEGWTTPLWLLVQEHERLDVVQQMADAMSRIGLRWAIVEERVIAESAQPGEG